MSIPTAVASSLWMCEGCGGEYPSELAAIQCEDEHDADQRALASMTHRGRHRRQESL